MAGGCRGTLWFTRDALATTDESMSQNMSRLQEMESRTVRPEIRFILSAIF